MKIVIDWLNDDGELVDVTRIPGIEPPGAFAGNTFGTQFVLRIDEESA